MSPPLQMFLPFQTSRGASCEAIVFSEASTMLQTSGPKPFAWRMSCFALTWLPELLDSGQWTTLAERSEARCVPVMLSSGRSSKPATEKERKKKQTHRGSVLGWRLPAAFPVPTPAPAPDPIPHTTSCWFPAGHCWIIGSHDRQHGVTLGWL